MKRLMVILMAAVVLAGLMAVPAFAADKLIVKDSSVSANTVFAVEDGASIPNRGLRVLSGVPIMQNAGNAGFDFRNTAATFGAAIVVGPSGNPNLYGNWLGATNLRDDATKVAWSMRLDITQDKVRYLRFPVGQTLGTDILMINGDGSLSSSTGATLTAGGTWQNSSSREYKENISALTNAEADAVLIGLNPVKYNYKVDKDERHVGFIAEDVPELVAAKDRKSLSPLDIVAVLTKVVQEQKETIARMSEKLERLEQAIIK